jgi:hypothetical protein
MSRPERGRQGTKSPAQWTKSGTSDTERTVIAVRMTIDDLSDVS